MSRPREFDVDDALHQCMEVFWTKGFKSTSYEDLTRTTGVKKQSLYCVFNDKRSLFLKVLAHYREQNITALEELEAQDTSPLNKLESIRLSLLRDEIMSRGCLMVNSAMEFGTEDEQVAREIKLMFAEAGRIIEKIIRSAQEQQLITTRYTSQELATYLNNAILGARTLGKSGASPEQIESALNTSFMMIMT
ncbi:TetR/AcrR family transcriptional regulator [Paenibacillus terreus]|uniref:TetR/AcrR family transcriptional regulator n=1 Tax=Paenibacillus terreus TaxID=1387834 RepID=A0ABV5BDA2_9BACL